MNWRSTMCGRGHGRPISTGRLWLSRASRSHTKGGAMVRIWFGMATVIVALTTTTFAQLAHAQAEPLRLGFLTVRTGALAAGGRQMAERIQRFLQESNHT